MPDLLYRNPIDGYDMVLVPAGKAILGERNTQFEAELPGYYLGIYCVTNEQYAQFLSAVQPGSEDLAWWTLFGGLCHLVQEGSEYQVDDVDRYGGHPVAMVSWHGAEAYCAWSGLWLPSEFEWEKGARGPEGLVYPWGNEWDATKCRHDGNRGSEMTCGLCEYPLGCSPWGPYNMAGNVSEWCADWYEKRP